MKILLIGDYSSVHWNLYTALRELGHNVEFISTGDGGKKIPTQTSWLTAPYSNFQKLCGVHDPLFLKRNSDLLESLQGFDVVQIINPILIEETSIRNNRIIFDNLRNRNKKVFLYSCGDDLNWVSRAVTSRTYTSMFKAWELYLSKELYHPARYLLDPRISTLSKHVARSVDGIIPGSVDYDWCIAEGEKKHAVIPFPLDLDLVQFRPPRRRSRYRAIHGFQPGKRIRKGDAFFEQAALHFRDEIDYERVGGLPFLDYLNRIADCDIFFDQTYSSDQGMNALFAMASGKIVFSGFSDRFYKTYDLMSPVGIDAKPNVMAIRSSIETLLAGQIDPEELGNHARRFVEKFHDKRIVAQKFLNAWSSV